MHFPNNRNGAREMKSWLAKNKTFVVFLLCLGVFRTAVADWNPIPSGSMRPTLFSPAPRKASASTTSSKR